MPRIINVREAKLHLSLLLDEVKAGNEIILAKGGRPCARLAPLESRPKRQLGFLAGELTADFLAPLPPEELEPWE